MASSSEYYNLYKQKKSEVKNLGNDIKDLNKIINKIEQSFDDDIRNINNKINDLKSDMEKAINYNTTYANKVWEIDADKEKDVFSDGMMSNARNALVSEVNSLENKKSDAEWEKDHYYDKYLDKKEEEHREMINAMKKFLTN